MSPTFTLNKFLSFLYFNKKRIGRLLFLNFCFSYHHGNI
ncbi:hypothetical protein CHCC20335_0445 [Bacillus paralicheniformis]|nr:hypothetical protein CHCC20335_0445 [Bacillus paralicheniformis]